jgi:exopolysaccharide biosynthesis polyprenyl glycosylphosphotransferase
MYRKNAEGWLKHIDFLVLDFLGLQLAFLLSWYLRTGNFSFLHKQANGIVWIVLVLFSICVSFLTENHRDIIRRGYLVEFKAVLKQTMYVIVCESMFLFLWKGAENFSRLAFLYFAVLYFLFLYVLRTFWKHLLRKYENIFEPTRNLLLVASADVAESMAEDVQEQVYGALHIIGVGLLDNPQQKSSIKSYQVLAVGDEILKMVQSGWVDEVLVRIGSEQEKADKLLERFQEMGLTTHIYLGKADAQSQTRVVENICGYTVMTDCLKLATPRQEFFKRGMDIAGAIVGLLVTAVAMLFIAPMIWSASPGPVFFSQERIGKGGKKFRMYKFRSMYVGADQQKKQLLKQNKMEGHMFKMDADPRVIGSGADGTRHGIGWFLRRTSLDELPQFLNVLKGDMSLVGTRPPTVDEWETYEYHHRARMAVKPGITGLWQVSGRSDITDFEEVVRLDMQYIKNWTLSEDVKILVKTVFVVIKGRGSR